jgi:hypothetical protein
MVVNIEIDFMKSTHSKPVGIAVDNELNGLGSVSGKGRFSSPQRPHRL